jgi:hypothetical protein
VPKSSFPACLPTCLQVKRIPEPMLAQITAKILPALAHMHTNHMVRGPIHMGKGQAGSVGSHAPR